MTSIAQTEQSEAPARDPAMCPRLASVDGVAALDYLTGVLGFVERRREHVGAGAPEDAMLAWLDFRDGAVMVGRAFDACHEVHQIYSPAEVGRATAMINVRVDDIDSHYRRAAGAGALVTMPPADGFCGFRRFEANDPEGTAGTSIGSFAGIRARGGQLGGDS